MTELKTATLDYDSGLSLKPMRPRTLVLLTLLEIALLLAAMGGIGSVMLAHIWSLYKDGMAWNPTEEQMGESAASAYGYGFFWATVATAVALMMWMYRCNRELRRLRHGPLRFSPVIAVLGWIVPYWCVIRPFEMMRELYAVARGESVRRFRPVVGGWWALWLVANCVAIFGQVALSSQKMEDADFQVASSIVRAVETTLYFLSGVLLFVVVYKIDRGLREQDRRSRVLGAQQARRS